MSDTDSLLGIAPRVSHASGAERSCLADRYRDAYRVASAVITVGTLIKVVAWFCAIVIWIVGFVAAGDAPRNAKGTFVFMALISGTVELVITFGLGVLVTAVGQILRATLDTAVHTSPFLNETEKLQTLG